MALKLTATRKPKVARLTDNKWGFDEEQLQAAEAAEVAEEYANTPSVTGGAADLSSTVGKSGGFLESAGGFMSQPGMGNAVAQGAGMVSSTMDPEGTGMGPALSGAASGAMLGTQVMPGYGTAIGAAVGLGLGLIKADSNRKEIQRKADVQAKGMMAQGYAKASNALKEGMQNRPNYTRSRGLKL